MWSPRVLSASTLWARLSFRLLLSLCAVRKRARLSYPLLQSPCTVRSKPDSATSFCQVAVLFVEDHTQLSSSAESLWRVESETDSALLLSVVPVHNFQGKFNKSLLSLWRRLSHPSTEFPLLCTYCERVWLSVVHWVFSKERRESQSSGKLCMRRSCLATLAAGWARLKATGLLSHIVECLTLWWSYLLQHREEESQRGVYSGSSKTSYSPVLNQGSRLIVRVIVFGTVLYCSALWEFAILGQYDLRKSVIA